MGGFPGDGCCHGTCTKTKSYKGKVKEVEQKGMKKILTSLISTSLYVLQLRIED